MVRWTLRFGRLNRENRPSSGSKASSKGSGRSARLMKRKPSQVATATGWSGQSALSKSLDVPGGGRADQPAVEGVGPGVVGTLDRLGEAAGVLLAEPGAPVPADVVERPVAARPVVQHDHALLADLLEEVLARLGDAVFTADADPALEEDLLHLLGQDLRRGEIFAGKGVGPIDGDLGRLDERGHGPALGSEDAEICRPRDSRGKAAPSRALGYIRPVTGMVERRRKGL